MAITIRDVAREAGVSTATVSRALRGLPNVEDSTRAKVHALAPAASLLSRHSWRDDFSQRSCLASKR